MPEVSQESGVTYKLVRKMFADFFLELLPRHHTEVGQNVSQIQNCIHQRCSNASPGSVWEHQQEGRVDDVQTQQAEK